MTKPIANPTKHDPQGGQPPKVKAFHFLPPERGGRDTAATREELLDLKWATAAIDGELKTLANLPREGINKPHSVFWVSLVKIASVIKGSGERHFTADQSLQLIQAVLAGGVFKPAPKEIERQWRNALAKSSPRYRPHASQDAQNVTRGAGFARRLGNTANYSYGLPENGRKRLSKWQAQDIARDILTDDFRTCYCMVRQNNGQTAVHVNGEGKAFYKGLMTCGSVWVCPVCATKIAARRAEEINQVIAQFGFQVVLITYTLQHSVYDKLEKLLGDLRDALTYTLNGRFRQRFYDAHNVVGSIRSVEHRVSLSTGWHPHAHELLLLRPGGKPEVEAIKSFLMDRYGKRLESKGYRVNDHTIDARLVTQKPDNELSDYLTKSAIELELTAGQNKPGASLSPFQLLAAYKETGEQKFADLFREYGEVTRGKRWINWTHELRKLSAIEEESDEEIADQEEGAKDDIPKLLLSGLEWERVCTKRLRGQLLRIAEKGDFALLQWLYANQIIIGESDLLVPERPPPPKVAVGSGK